eukprot:gnl/TRDRNA2_/TRDRNA2_185343_c0_seq1.p1 gnl/TRDRNA2_/TRDRNA2_185343_c0~~gnl/TRDRNA2_/TRDRNA2_185343_c0_seq1.p1  ORF type:complete len:303 (+),score=40.08 gnl/TRDRNA2_/TRDRNA2_185343_c0_seq1:71-979(+)
MWVLQRLQQVCVICAGLAGFTSGSRLKRGFDEIPHSLVHKQAEVRTNATRMNATEASSSSVDWGPTVVDWIVPGSWAGPFYEFAPAQVVDLCGGWTGNTTWSMVSRPCAEWVVKMTKCYQACFQTNRIAGFGVCMDGCSGKPEYDAWCHKPDNVKKKIKKTCREMNHRWKKCRISEHMWETPEEWFEAVDKCVFVCKTSLETQMALGLKYTLSWRKRKCNPEIYYCNFDKEKCMHAKAVGDFDPQNAHCAPPVGRFGSHKCFFDDPECGPGCKKPDPAPAPGPFPYPFPAPAPAVFLSRPHE